MNKNNLETLWLHNAVLDNDFEKVRLLVKMGADLNLLDKKGLKPLHLAILSNNTEIICLFMRKSEIDIHTFQLAIMLDNILILQLAELYQGIEKIQKMKNSQGETLVHYSVKYRSISFLKECIKYNLNLNDVDVYGYSPLHLAVINNDTKIVELLLKSGADVYVKTLDGRSSIHLAVKYQCFEMLLKLIDSNMDVNDPITSTGLYPLHIAVKNNDEKTVYLLIRVGGNIQCTDKEGKNLLHVAIENEHENMVKILLKEGVKVDVRFSDEEESVLDLALNKGNSEIVSAVLNCQPDINSKNKEGLNALFVAIQNRDLKAVKQIFSLKPDFNAVTNNNDSLLHYALQNEIEYVVNYCLKNNVNINVINNDGDNVLHFALEYNYDAKVVSQLIHKGLDVNSRTGSNLTPLHIAIERNCDVVEILLKNGADINATDDERETPLFYCVSNRFFSKKTFWNKIEEIVIPLLLKKKANVNIFDNTGNTPLHYLMSNRHFQNLKELILLFIKHGANIKEINKDGDTILHIYLKYGDQQNIINLFLENGGNINQLNSNNQTPLQVYLKKERLRSATFEYLLQKGATLTKNEMGENALHLAIKKSAENIVQILLKKKLINLNENTIDGSTVLHYAIKYHTNSNKILNALLLYYKETDVTDNEGKTPLHLAVIKDSIELVQILLFKNADVNAIDNLRNSPLYYAISKKNVEIIRLLLHKGASTSGTYGESSIYDLAKQTGNEHIYHMLMFFTRD